MRAFLLAGFLALAVIGSAGPAAAADVQLFVRHEVADYAAWRKAFDGFQAKAHKMGATSGAVYRSVDNPNDVTVRHGFKSAEKARAFIASPELKTAMEGAGVKGAPQAWITNVATK
jgi:opacity protein-like surface antigen